MAVEGAFHRRERVFEARSAVEQHDALILAHAAAGQFLLIGRVGRRAFGAQQQPFLLGHVAAGLLDVIFYPTGGGTGLIGMVKAFDELEAIGWIGSKRPRMVAVQASGCAPIARHSRQ